MSLSKIRINRTQTSCWIRYQPPTKLPKIGYQPPTKLPKIQSWKTTAKDTLPQEPMSPSQQDGRILSVKRQNKNPSSYRRVNWSHQLPPKPQYIPAKEPHAHENPSNYRRVNWSHQLPPKPQYIPAKELHAHESPSSNFCEQLLLKSQHILAKESHAQDDDSVSFPAIVEKLLQKKEQMFPPNVDWKGSIRFYRIRYWSSLNSFRRSYGNVPFRNIYNRHQTSRTMV